ncbi:MULTISPECIES: bifunctional riboflavin kinase/FAD synthetase [Candidatus Ichthyocystis]|uniref:Riboflavin biosynthesis protein n=1 Tax=Candidatus Ichthyocystis hellenicum TaxID=1561003 RepID=A0A0S4LZE2_9BURK|nr:MULTISPECIES: bifunctional riboflavin kinase/FAD synthetase [Ichthyocystis]CUT16931.1 bifunctional riboflavin kinase/FMN adenylyltransferase [Candidatus Ichthyocystis hellenicum]
MLLVYVDGRHKIKVHRCLNSDLSQPLALTIGNFDGIHLGHQSMLARLRERSREKGLQTAVMLFYPHPRFFFQPTTFREVWTLRDKIINLARLGIEHVYIARFNEVFSNYSARFFVEEIMIKSLHVKYLVVGKDFLFGANRCGETSLLREYSDLGSFNFEIVPDIFDDGKRLSSTMLRTALSAHEFDRVHSLLGFPYHIFDRVRYGRQLGRQLGFPTINLRPSVNSVLQGTFVVKVHGLGDSPFPGVGNIGRRPTLSSTDNVDWLEVHLLDFSENIYGRRVFVEFLAHLHEERRYASHNELALGIRDDCAAARSYFNKS